MNTENDVTNNHPSIHVGQKFRLLQAMLLARNPGACEYVRDGKPMCVIGQLAVKEGADPEAMEEWGGKSVRTIHVPNPLQVYPLDLLYAVQIRFDKPHYFGPPLPAMYRELLNYPVRNVQPGDMVNGMRVSSSQDADSFTRFFSAGCATLEEMVQDRIDQGAE